MMPENPNLERIASDLGQWRAENAERAALLIQESIARALIEIARSLDKIERSGIPVRQAR